MSTEQLTDTDLVNELVTDFGRNQAILAELVAKVTQESKTNFNPIAQAKLSALRRAVLVEDLKNQNVKIEMITDILKQICSPIVLPTA